MIEVKNSKPFEMKGDFPAETQGDRKESDLTQWR
jgi:hypothetical protein